MPRSPIPFEDRLEAERARIEKRVALLRDGPSRDKLIQKIKRLETAVRTNRWLSASEAQPQRSEPRR